MGAPKQKWTAEEEAALKAGVRKYGTGKWQKILTDTEFSHVLRSRSNVDLKDKWRNINVTLSGLGSREKARLALKRNPQIAKVENKPSVVNIVPNNENGAEAIPAEAKPAEAIPAEAKPAEAKPAEAKPIEVKPVGTPSEAPMTVDSKKSYTRLDKLVLEAITTLREPKGSDRNAISMFIEDQYWAPSNFSNLLASKLKSMTANGQLFKVKNRYRIPPPIVTSSEGRRNSSSDGRRNSSSDGKHRDLSRAERAELKFFTRPQVVAELDNMRKLSAHEAASVAARAVAEAEAAIAEAEKAAREAEAAEAEAEAAKVFAEAAMKALQCQRLRAC